MPQADSRSITPALPRALPTAARKKVETAIECHLAAVTALTAFLDEADGDPDHEPTNGSLGCTFDAEHSDQTKWAGGTRDDREHDPADPPPHEGIDDNELDGTDGTGLEGNEPELGWPERINQERALKSCMEDGASCGGEPSLGSCESIDQRGWSQGDCHDREADYLDGMTGRARFADGEPECEDEGAEHDGREDRSAPFELIQDGAP